MKENMNKKIEYSFTAIPTNMIYIMDSDCLKVFSILLHKHTYWLNKGMLEDGYFIKSIDELQKEMNMKNQKDVRCIIQALVNASIVDVIAIDKKRHTAKFRLNEDRINELATANIGDMLDSGYYIEKLKRTDTITYCIQNVPLKTNTDNNQGVQNVPLTDIEKSNKIQNVDKLLTKCTPTKDIIDNNIYININKNNNIIINKKENSNNIIIEEKEEFLNNDIIKKMKEAESIDDSAPVKRKREYTIYPSNEEVNDWEDKWLESFIPISI